MTRVLGDAPTENLATVDWQRVATGPTTEGRVELIVRRLANEGRDLPVEVSLSVEQGLVGDRWCLTQDPDPMSQITLLNCRVARMIAGDGARLREFGDNFLVDLELGAANLPAGTRLRLGEAELEVTSEPHLGCAKFARRFGHDVLRIVNRKDLVPLNLRGIHARVRKPGKVWLGAPATKLAGR